jgi:riboflavin synthase alpha subunit
MADAHGDHVLPARKTVSNGGSASRSGTCLVTTHKSVSSCLRCEVLSEWMKILRLCMLLVKKQVTKLKKLKLSTRVGTEVVITHTGLGRRYHQWDSNPAMPSLGSAWQPLLAGN